MPSEPARPPSWVSEDEFSVADPQAAQPAVVTFPAEVDVRNSGWLGLQLDLALTSAATVIADLSATTFCDCSGVRVLLLAHEQAAAAGAELRVVTRSAIVLRLLALTGAERLLPTYPTLDAALGSRPRARERASFSRMVSSGLGWLSSRPASARWLTYR